LATAINPDDIFAFNKVAVELH